MASSIRAVVSAPTRHVASHLETVADTRLNTGLPSTPLPTLKGMELDRHLGSSFLQLVTVWPLVSEQGGLRPASLLSVTVA